MQRQVITIIIFLLYVILAEEVSASECTSPGRCVSTVNCKLAVQQIKIKGDHNLTLCKIDDPNETVCCPSTELERGVKSREACQQWKKSAPTAVSQMLTSGNAKKKEFSHTATLGFYRETDRLYYIYCAGSIISERYILTVVHCSVNIHGDKLKFVRIGTVELPESVEQPDPALDYNVEEVKVHEQYNRRLRLNDIALLKLEKTLSWTDFIRPACLYLKNDDPAPLYLINSLDLNLEISRNRVLLKNVVKSVALSECNVTYFSSRNSLSDTHICATGESICAGDSGRPLQIDEPNSIIIVGIASYGKNLACHGKYPAVFTRVYSYVDWIENIVWP